MSFDQLGLRVELLQAVTARGYAAPTLIQAKTVPVILQGRDILARAQTGTGKTDAFALPLVEILSRQTINVRYPRALVLTPTRELALQVGETMKQYARRVSMRCTVVHGGVNIEPQIERLKRGIDIVVATPGRLLDLAGQGHAHLSRIEFLVFDEADRMLDLGFSREISAILDLLPTQRRTMLFSATYTREIRDLAAQILLDPEYIEVTPSCTAAESVLQKVHLVDQANKRALLVHLITVGKWSRTLVFCRTKHGANRITEKLVGQGFRAAALHGNKSQSLRTRTLAEFRKGEIRILVATDVAARGLDISNLPCVVNYDLPQSAEEYIHRIGRTGRAGESGLAVSLVSQEERSSLQAIETGLGSTIPVETVPGFTEESAVPDYVRYRPNSAESEKKADRSIKELVAARKAKKGTPTRGKTAGSNRRSGTTDQTPSGRRNDKTGRKTDRSGFSGSQSLKQGKRRGRG
jgi:ATP-dependent RNA helicase RhlE